MEEKKSIKQSLKTMPTKRKVMAVVIALLILTIPIGAVAYQLNHKKPTAKSSKSTANKNSTKNGVSDGASSNDKLFQKPGSNSSPNSSLKTRLDRFNKDALAKRIEQGLQGKRITEAQAKALNKKLAEIEKFVKTTKAKDSSAQSKAISDKRKELQKWANDNNIPTRYIVGWL